MQTAFCMATAVAVVLNAGLVSFAQGKPAETGIAVEERQSEQRSGSSTGVSVAVPLGRVSIAPESADGEPVFVRRTVKEGIAIVEVSATPFVPVLPSNQKSRAVDGFLNRPDQPASW